MFFTDPCLLYLGDWFGYLLAWSSLSPIFIGVGLVTLILFRRDLHTVSETYQLRELPHQYFVVFLYDLSICQS